MDRLRAMRVYVRVARLGSFSAAARELRLSPAAVSRQVAALEEHLGARLLERTTRRLRRTEVGERTLERCERILSDVAALEEEVAEGDGEAVGTLRVSAPSAFGPTAVAPLLPGFLAAHPRLSVELAFSDEYVDLLEQGIDVAVRAGRLDDSTLRGRRLGETLSLLVASPAYLERAGRPTSLAELATHDGLCDTNQRNPRWAFSTDGAITRVQPRVRLAMNHPHALCGAAIAGLGIAQLPHFAVAEALAAGTLRELLPEVARQPIPVHAVSPAHRERAPRVERFVAHLVEHFRLPPPPPPPPPPIPGPPTR